MILENMNRKTKGLEITSSHDVRIIWSYKGDKENRKRLEITSSHDVRIINKQLDIWLNREKSRNYFLTWCEDNCFLYNRISKKISLSRNYFLTWCEDNFKRSLKWHYLSCLEITSSHDVRIIGVSIGYQFSNKESRNYFLTWCEDNS